MMFVFWEEKGVADTGTHWLDRVTVGGYLGPDLATSAGPGANDESVSACYKRGWSIGALTSVRLHERFATQLELALTIQGPHAKTGDVDFGTYNIKYLEIPILARFMLPLPGASEYFATVGPTVGILLDADVDLADGRHFELDSGRARGTGWGCYV